jgi:hypothetical protein
VDKVDVRVDVGHKHGPVITMLSIQISLRGEEMGGGDERQMKGCVCAGGAGPRRGRFAKPATRQERGGGLA